MKLINFRLDISGLSIKGCSERAKVNIEYGIRFYRCLENRDCERYITAKKANFFPLSPFSRMERLLVDNPLSVSDN